MPLTMLDIAKLSGNDEVVGLIEENLRYAPEVDLFASRTIRGTTYKTATRVGLPSVGFRKANKGNARTKSEFRQQLVQTYILGGALQVDRAVAMAHEDGSDALLTLEASGATMAAFRALGSQIYYGTVKDELGFPGLKAATPLGGVTINGDSVTVNAGGNTANTASSVYAVKFGEQDVQLLWGMDSTLNINDTWGTQQVEDDEGKAFEAFVNNLTAWSGMQIGNENCVRRLCNLTVANGLTDALLAQLMETFPVGYTPDVLLMSRRSRSQLQQSRSVSLNGNAKVRPDQPKHAPLPTEYEGIPIVATDSILNTDAIETI